MAARRCAPGLARSRNIHTSPTPGHLVAPLITAPQVARALHANMRLRALTLDDTEIGAASAEALGAALLRNQTLTALSLRDNPRLDDRACEPLNYALYHNSVLKAVDLRGCSVTIVNRALESERSQLAQALPEAMRALRVTAAEGLSSQGGTIGRLSSASGGGGSAAPSPTGSLSSGGGGGGGPQAPRAPGRASSSLSSASASIPMNRLAALNVGAAGLARAGSGGRGGGGAGGRLSESELGQALRSSHLRSLQARR